MSHLNAFGNGSSKDPMISLINASTLSKEGWSSGEQGVVPPPASTCVLRSTSDYVVPGFSNPSAKHFSTMANLAKKYFEGDFIEELKRESTPERVENALKHSVKILAKRLMFGKGHQEVESDDRKKKMIKFKESAWKCIYFLSAEILALSVTYNEPWLRNTKYFWVGPGDQVWPDQKIKTKLKVLYMYAAGFYTYSIFALIFWETRRSDFGVSMGHHVASVILIVLSYIFRFARVGSVVLALHDASDVFLEVGKMSKYSGAEGLASFAFVLFVLSWILLRLIYYPFWVLWSTSYEVLLTLDKDKHLVEGPIYYYIFNSLLYCLLVLHIYWWVLIYRMLVKQIQNRGQLSDDVRSDSEGEDEHED